jgi:hypothetical protein
MATRSNIGYVGRCPQGSVNVAYCHYDGDILHQAPLLLEHYNTQATAVGLVLNGYMSSLHPTLEEINKNRVHKDRPTRYREGLPEYLAKVSSDIEYMYIWGEFSGDKEAGSPRWQVYTYDGKGNQRSAPLLTAYKSLQLPWVQRPLDWDVALAGKHHCLWTDLGKKP